MSHHRTAQRLWRTAAVVLATFVVALTSAPSLAAAAEETEAPEFGVDGFRATAVDATDNDVEVGLISTDLSPDSADISVTNGEDAAEVTNVTTSQAENRPTELVIIVDTNARSAQGETLRRLQDQLIADAGELSSETSVAVVSAGDTALVETRLTNDRQRLFEAINDLSLKNGTSLYNAIDRAGTLFSDDPDVTRSVLIFATGGDTASDVTLQKAQVGLVAARAQVVSVRYQGGDPALSAAVNATGGMELSIEEAIDLELGLAEAWPLATDRLLVSFESSSEAGTRTNVTLAIGEHQDTFSYPTGVLTQGPLQLAPLPESGSSGFVLFQGSAWLYIALALAFVGISLGVWSIGSIMTGSEANLEGLLSRYADGNTELDDDEADELIVQSALLQRAANFSESFAEKRGFLARVEELLEQADLPVRAGEAMSILIAITLLSSGLGLALSKSILVAFLLGLFAAGLSFFIVRFLGRRRFKKFESQLPDTLQLLSGTLRAGYSLPQGLEVVSHEIADPMGQELRRAMTEARLGRDIEECLGGVAERLSSSDFAWAVMAIGIQREVGGNLNELLMSVADTMIQRERLKREIGALTAEGKMSAAVLSFLPPGLGFVMWLMNPDYVSLLFTELLGNIMLGLGIVSALVGLAWMKKVITVDV